MFLLFTVHSLETPWYYGLASVWISFCLPETPLATMKKAAVSCVFIGQYCCMKCHVENTLYCLHIIQKSSILEP